MIHQLLGPGGDYALPRWLRQEGVDPRGLSTARSRNLAWKRKFRSSSLNYKCATSGMVPWECIGIGEAIN
ncbi:MAG: hypothetical protein KatS3mg105_1011 [Gemmatales bacterium]|nr:MAG: hypothetical protein KatS3mg105_1011 [Gemmatales bacterium]